MKTEAGNAKFTWIFSTKNPKKSAVVPTDHCAPSSVPLSGFGTLDLANLDAGSDLLLMPAYPIKLAWRSRPLSAQHPILIQTFVKDKPN